MFPKIKPRTLKETLLAGKLKRGPEITNRKRKNNGNQGKEVPEDETTREKKKSCRKANKKPLPEGLELELLRENEETICRRKEGKMKKKEKKMF